MNAVFFLSDDKYWPITKNALDSFFRHNFSFDGEVNVIYLDEKIPEYENIIFRKVNKNCYKTKHFSLNDLIKLLGICDNKIKTIFKIEAFNYHDIYNKILYLDSDIIIKSNLEDIFKSENSLIYRYPQTNKTNSGVYYSSKQENKKYYKEIISRLYDLSRINVEEPIFSKVLTEFKTLDPKYNDSSLSRETIIYHMQFYKRNEVLRIQNEYNLL